MVTSSPTARPFFSSTYARPYSVVEPLPDLGAKPPAQDPDEAERVAALEAENADLKKQVAEQGDQITKLTADLEKATKPGK